MNILAVVGMGSIAQRHLANLRLRHPAADIYVVSASGNNTILPKKADSIISLEELILLAPDYVIVASPAPHHVDVAQKLLTSNIPVLIEKPLADSVQRCAAFQTYCEQKKIKTVAVGYCLRFLPSAKVVKNYLDKGLLGTVYNIQSNVGQYLPDWRADKKYKDSVSSRKCLGGGALLELSHELDYLQWFLGDLTLQHSCLRTTDELGIDVEDIANLVLFSKKNVHVSVHLDFIQKSTQRSCEIIGQHGRLFWDLLENTVVLYHSSGKATLYSGTKYDKNNIYLDMLADFENMINGGKNSLARIETATKIVKIIDEAKELNRWRKIG